MSRQKVSPRQYIIQRVLVSGVVLGIVFALLRMILAFIGAISTPAAMNDVPTAVHASSGFVSFLLYLAPFIFAVSPYLLAAGSLSAFLYVYLFRDKETQNLFIGWGVLMALYLIAILFFVWI